MTREDASYILRKFYADGYKSNNYNTLEQALQLAVMCLENFPHWISVEDELPPRENRVPDKSIDVLATDSKTTHKSFYDYNLERWLYGDLWQLDDVTHWMYLPSVEHLKDK